MEPPAVHDALMLPWAFRMASFSFMSMLCEPRERYLSSTESCGMMFFSLSFLREPITLLSDLTFLSLSDEDVLEDLGGQRLEPDRLPVELLDGTCFLTSWRATW